MKKRFINTAKGHGANITSYKTYRSDMGCQVYAIEYTINGRTRRFDDSYFPSEMGSNDKVIRQFGYEINNIKHESTSIS